MVAIFRQRRVLLLGIALPLLGVGAADGQAAPDGTASGSGTATFGPFTNDDPTEPVALRPFHALVPRAELLGDWDGVQPDLSDKGIAASLTYVDDLAGNVSGGESRGFTSVDNLDLTLMADLNKLLGWEGAGFYLSLCDRGGESLSTERVGNVFQIQQVYGGETFHLIDVAYDQRLLAKHLDLHLGRIAAGDDFLVSPYDWLFMQNGFCGNPVGIFYNAPGMSAYPNAAWGALLKVRPTGHTYVQAGVYNGDAEVRGDDLHGADFSLKGPPFFIAEAGYRPNALPEDTGLIGDYKVGVWYDGNRFDRYTTEGDAAPGQQKAGNYGYYVLFDQLLVAFAPGAVDRGLGMTGCFQVAPDQAVSEIPYFYDVGLVARGFWAHHPRDMGGLGFLSGQFSGDLAQAETREELFGPTAATPGIQSRESVIELTYRTFLVRRGAVFLQPDVQYILRPDGTGRIPNAWVLGSQIGINF